MWVFMRTAAMAVVLCLAGCASTPERQNDVCEVFSQQPRWYDHAVRSRERWGTPVPVQMAIVQQESSFRRRARPPRKRLLGIIPWRRPSSAYGYAQAVDLAWQDYVASTGRSRASRARMRDALDFVGWYNDVSHRRLGLAKHDARELYLAYHEGHTGYQRGAWRGNPALLQAAARVEERAQRYAAQFAGCERQFRCRRWYQFGPFCG
jgi:hypothetical protein